MLPPSIFQTVIDSLHRYFLGNEEMIFLRKITFGMYLKGNTSWPLLYLEILLASNIRFVLQSGNCFFSQYLWHWKSENINVHCSQAYSKSCQLSKMVLFAKTVSGWQMIVKILDTPLLLALHCPSCTKQILV